MKYYIKQVFRNEFLIKIFESFMGRGSVLLFTLLFSLVCTRLYGAEIFGKYTYGMTIVSVFMLVGKAGLDNGLMYSIPKNKYKHVSLSFITNFIISTILVFVLYFIINEPFILFMLPMIWLISAEEIFFGIYRSEGEIKEYYVVNGFIGMLIRVITPVILYYLVGKSVFSIIMGVYLALVVSNIIYFVKHKSKFGKITFDKSYLMYSFPLLLATVMETLINRVDIIMIGNMLTDKDVGIYQIAFQISNMVSISLMIFNTVFAPKIASLYHQNRMEELKKLYIKATRVLAIISLLLTLIIIICSSIVLNFFGEEFSAGQSTLIIRSIGQLFYISVGGVWLMLSMTGKPLLQMYVNMFALLLNVIFNYLLIPKIGINGAALASMLTTIFMSLFGYIVVSKRFNLRVFKIF